MALMRTLGLVLAVLSIAQAQFDCQCDGVPCVQDDNADSIGECIKTPRPDCPCCLVCPRQEGQECDELTQPCDLSRGLFCNTTSSRCEKEKVTCLSDNGILHQPGDMFNDEKCESRCECTDVGNIVCQPLNCPTGLIRRGYLAGDPLCVERPAPEHQNECCVLVVCASVEEEDNEDDDRSLSLTKEPLKPVQVDNIQFLQITPTTIQVQFPDITGGNLMYVEERLFRQKDVPWENAIILAGNKIFTLTGLDPGTKYRLRWQAPDTQYPDMEVDTQPLINKKAPKVIVTQKTFESFTLSFDHFAPEGYDHGYVALYKPVTETRWQTIEGTPGNKDLPTITISGLKPDTAYEARIAIYEDFSIRSLGKSTGIINVTTDKGCQHDNVARAVGQFYVDCDLSCQCYVNGTVKCTTRCKPPFHEKGTTAGDPLCVEQPVDGDSCCVVVTCAGSTIDDDEDGPCSEIKCGPNARCRHEVFRGAQAETICVCNQGFTGDPDSAEGCYEHHGGSLQDSVTISPPDGCLVNNRTYSVNEKWNDGCDYTCTCSEKHEILCQPRCTELPDRASDKCELRPHPEDECCKVMYCPDPDDLNLKPVPEPFEGCVFKNATYLQGQRFYDGCEQQCQCMGFGDMVCLSRCPPTAPAPGQNCVTLQDPSDPCCNITVCDDPILDPAENVDKEASKEPRILNLDGCTFNGKNYQHDEEFYDGCDSFCYCGTDGNVVCNAIKCPSSFGLDVINPFCLEWESHEDFQAQPPMCCPPVPKCKTDGACVYKDRKFNNYDNIPANLTGCEERCYCENGEVLCQPACYEISPEPPGYLSCAKEEAIKVPNEDRPCCQTWGCPKLPKVCKIHDVKVKPENATSFEIDVRLPKSLDGQEGFFTVYYSNGFQGHPNWQEWPSKEIRPHRGSFEVDDNELSSFVLGGLLPNQQYFLRVSLHCHFNSFEVDDEVVVSDILSGSTPLLPKRDCVVDCDIVLRSIDVELAVDDVKANSAFISWRFFSFDEKQYVDGVQIRSNVLINGSLTSGVPGTTPFIHRDVNYFTLRDLKSDTEYQVDLYLIPVPKSKIELTSETVLKFRTAKQPQDPFDFKLVFEAAEVGSHWVDLAWYGVPMPRQKYVNLYRILYVEENVLASDPHSAFIVSNIDSISSTRLDVLRPSTAYMLWLEVYLRNGKVVKSNVLPIETKDGPPATGVPFIQGANPLSDVNEADTNYYTSMIIAAIIASVALLAFIIVAGLYLKRTTTYKAIISGDGAGKRRKSAFSTNRTFKASTTSIQMSPCKTNGVELNGSELNRSNGDSPTKS